jgi:hypothetical protein
MKLKSKLATALLLGAGLLAAAPPNCKQDTLEAYIDMGPQGCALGAVVYANFSYQADATGGATIITAGQITVTPIVIPVTTGRFTFSALWKVAGGQTQKSVISYTASLPAGDSLPGSLELTLGTATVRGLVGSVKVDEATNLVDSSGNRVALHVFDQCVEVCSEKLFDSFDFNPTNIPVFILQDTVTLSGGDGGATLDSFANLLNTCIVCASN